MAMDLRKVEAVGIGKARKDQRPSGPGLSALGGESVKHCHGASLRLLSFDYPAMETIIWNITAPSQSAAAGPAFSRSTQRPMSRA